MSGAIDGRVYGLQTSVVNELKKGPITADKVLAAVSKDGVIDAKEQELLDEIEAGGGQIEISDKSEAEIGKAKSESSSFDPIASKQSVKLDFGKVGTKVKEQTLSEAAATRASGLSMKTRAEARRQLGSDLESATRLLSADQTMTSNPAQHRINLESARKMLVQDMVLLEKLGVLSSDEKGKLDEIIDFMKKNITKDVPISTLKKQVEELNALIAPHLEDLKGASPADVLTVDQGALSVTNSDAGGSIDDQMAVVDDNYDALLAAGEAAVDDVKVSGLETGLSSDIMQGAKVNAGRDFGRMLAAIDEADKQYSMLTENAIPTTEKFIAATNDKFNARLMSLYGKSTLDEAKAAMAADPSKAQSDEQLKTLDSQRSAAIVKLGKLGESAKALAQARVDGLKQFKEVKTIHTEMLSRVSDIKLTDSGLQSAYQGIAPIRAKVDKAKAEIAALNEQAKALDAGDDPQKAAKLEAIKAQISQKMKAYPGAQKELEAVRAKMEAGLTQLYDKLKAGGATSVELKLVMHQIDSIRGLKFSEGMNLDDIEGDLKKLEGARTETLGELKKMVPARLDIREFKALTHLDGSVTKGSRAVLDMQRGIQSGKLDAAAAQEGIDVAITAAKSDIGAAESIIGKAKSLDDPKKGGYVGLAYGSHFGVELWAGLGIGADIGVAEAKISASLNAALKVSKDFEHGERPYRLQVDVGIKIEGDLTIAKIFEAHPKIKFGLSAGLAFKDLGEVGDFAKRMGKIMALSNAMGHISSVEDIEKIQAELDKEISGLEKVIDEKGYTGKYVEISADAKSQLPGANVGVKGSWRRQVNTYNDGQKVSTDNFMGKVTVGEFGVRVTHNRSKVTEEHGKPVEGKPTSTRTAVHVTIPTEMIKHALHHGGFKNLPKGLMEEIVKQFKALNPGMAEMSTGIVLGYLDKGLSQANGNGTLSKILDMAKPLKSSGHGHSHGETEITIGIEYVEHFDDKHGEGYFAVEFGIESEKEYKKDIPLGTSGGFLRLGAKAEAELGVYVKIPGTKTELHPPTGGAHH